MSKFQFLCVLQIFLLMMISVSLTFLNDYLKFNCSTVPMIFQLGGGYLLVYLLALLLIQLVPLLVLVQHLFSEELYVFSISLLQIITNTNAYIIVIHLSRYPMPYKLMLPNTILGFKVCYPFLFFFCHSSVIFILNVLLITETKMTLFNI